MKVFRIPFLFGIWWVFFWPVAVLSDEVLAGHAEWAVPAVVCTFPALGVERLLRRFIPVGEWTVLVAFRRGVLAYAVVALILFGGLRLHWGRGVDPGGERDALVLLLTLWAALGAFIAGAFYAPPMTSSAAGEGRDDAKGSDEGQDGGDEGK